MAKIGEFCATNITTFTSAIVDATKLFGGTRPWWRGQKQADWNLQPSLFNRGLAHKEENLNARFKLMAKVRRGEVPNSSDSLGWLFLMQHYRLPTRLLDWSQSPLVALYFAVEKPDDTDAAIWGLCPTRLNRIEGKINSICMPGSPTIGGLGIQAFKKNVEQIDERILAVLTEEADLRHMVQQSAFTIHGRNEPLDRATAANEFLIKIRIPSTAKERLRQALALFGISRASLFPDLENLALELQSLDFDQQSEIAKFADDLQIETG